MEFKQLAERALAIRKKYAEFEKKRYGREGTTEELMLGFMKDMGDLAKLLVKASEDVRRVDDLDNAIGHELSDCMWSIILADKLGVDLEKSFGRIDSISASMPWQEATPQIES